MVFASNALSESNLPSETPISRSERTV